MESIKMEQYMRNLIETRKNSNKNDLQYYKIQRELLIKYKKAIIEIVKENKETSKMNVKA